MAALIQHLGGTPVTLQFSEVYPALQRGVEFLSRTRPSRGNMYFNYYATQVMFHMKGEHWRRWNDKLRPLLVDSQLAQGNLAGSWNPGGEIPDRWGGAGGRPRILASGSSSHKGHPDVPARHHARRRRPHR